MKSEEKLIIGKKGKSKISKNMLSLKDASLIVS